MKFLLKIFVLFSICNCKDNSELKDLILKYTITFKNDLKYLKKKYNKYILNKSTFNNVFIKENKKKIMDAYYNNILITTNNKGNNGNSSNDLYSQIGFNFNKVKPYVMNKIDKKEMLKINKSSDNISSVVNISADNILTDFDDNNSKNNKRIFLFDDFNFVKYEENDRNNHNESNNNNNNHYESDKEEQVNDLIKQLRSEKINFESKFKPKTSKYTPETIKDDDDNNFLISNKEEYHNILNESPEIKQNKDINIKMEQSKYNEINKIIGLDNFDNNSDDSNTTTNSNNDNIKIKINTDSKRLLRSSLKKNNKIKIF